MVIIKTVCHRDCPDTCFIDVQVKNGKIISTRGSSDNPVTQGFICRRGTGDPKRVYSKERILFPHTRSDKNSSEKFKRISWKDATRIIAEKLQEVIDQYGKEYVLLLDYPGNQGFLAWQYPRRLWNALGVTKTDYALCSTSGHEGLGLHYGLSYGLQPEDHLNLEVITYWGNNARVSSYHQWRLSQKARKERGTTIISIDPRQSETAKASDIWLNPRPGSDVALAYGLARYLIKNDYVNMEFVEKWTRGYDQYKKESLKWTPERITRITGLKWELIAELGEIYYEKRPGIFMIGLGMQKSLHGAEATRAVSLLPALLGSHRGFHYSDSNGRFVDWDYLNGSKLTKKTARVVHQVGIGPEIESGNYKFIFIYGMNPAATLPDQIAIRSGFSKKNVFVVVHDTHWTETTNYADVVLPASTYLEKTDVNFSDHHLYCRLSKKVIEPLGESKNEITLMHELAKEQGLKDNWIFEDPWEALGKSLVDAFQNGTFNELLEGKVLKLKLRPMNKYQTRSGRIEFYSSKAEELGYNPLPEQLTSEPEEGWFILLNSTLPNYTSSQFRDVYGPIPQVVWISTKDAKKLGIENDEKVVIYNHLGEVTLRAIVTNKSSQGVVWAPRPLTGINNNPLNALTSSIPQKIGGGPVFNSTKVKIRRLI